MSVALKKRLNKLTVNNERLGTELSQYKDTTKAVQTVLSLIPKYPTLTLQEVTVKDITLMYKGKQYKVSCTDIPYLNNFVLDNKDWKSYFTEDLYSSSSIGETLYGITYRALGYTVYIAKQHSLADRQGIDLITINPKTQERRLIQVKGTFGCLKYSSDKSYNFKYDLFNIEVVALDTAKLFDIVPANPITQFIRDIFLLTPTTANLWHKIDLPICPHKDPTQGHKYVRKLCERLGKVGIYAVPSEHTHIGVYNFKENVWTYYEVRSATSNEVFKVINKDVYG